MISRSLPYYKICMDQEFKAIDFLLANIRANEPCLVYGFWGMGMKILYEGLKSTLEEEDLEQFALSYSPNTKYELKEIIKNVQARLEHQKVVLILSLSMDQDYSDFLEELANLRYQYSVKFTFIVISNISTIRKLVTEKSLIHIYPKFILKPTDEQDSQKYLNKLQEWFNHKLTMSQTKAIVKLSGGHPGLIKSLFLLLKHQINIEVDNVEKILAEESIECRIQNSLEDIFLKGKIDLKNKEFLDRIGFLKDGEVFSPLFKNYIENRVNENDLSSALALTKTESDLLEFFQRNISQLVSRKDIAHVIWANNWEDKYSDWAIDQTVSRLRAKIKQTNMKYNLITKRGQGFILITKS